MVKRNLTLAIDEDLLERSRLVAIRRHTSVNDIIRSHLEEVVRSDERGRAARQRLIRLWTEPEIDVGRINWNRDDLHER